MHYSGNQLTGDIGELIVKKEFAKLFKWPYRRQEVDLGIDAEFEILLEGNLASGKIVKVQVKATEEPFKDGINTIYPAHEHVEYWKNFSVPVILCAVSTSTEEILWKVIDPDGNYKTPKGAKVEFDRAADKLDINAKPKFEKIAVYGNSIVMHLANITMQSLRSYCDESGNAWISIDSEASLAQHSANEQAINMIYRLIELSKGRTPEVASKMVSTMNRLWNQIDMELDRQRKEDLY